MGSATKNRGTATLLVAALSALAGGGGCALAVGPYHEIKVLGEGPREVLFRFALPEVETEPMGGGLEALRAGELGILSQPGFPALPFRPIVIAIPPGAEADVDMPNPVIERSDRYRVAPAPRLIDEEVASFEWDPKLPGGLYPGHWFDLSAPTKLRDQWVVTLNLYPVRYDRATGQTALLKSAAIRVRFRGGQTEKRADGAAPRQDRFERVYERTILNYRSSVDWRTTQANGKKRSRAADSFASSRNWVRLAITERALHAIEYDDLLGAGILDPRSAIGDARSIRIYAGGTLPLPEEIFKPRLEWMSQVAIRVVGEEDGAFDPGDRIELFALPATGWIGEFDPDTTRYYDHFNHPYADENVFWLTWGGSFQEPVKQRMGRIEAGDGIAEKGSAVPIRTYSELVHYEADHFQDLTRFGSDGWFWDKFSGSQTDKSFRDLQAWGVDTAQPSRLRVELYHYSFSTNRCGPQSALFWVNDIPADSAEWNSCHQPDGYIVPMVFDTVGFWIKEGANEVRIQVKQRPEVYLSWIELGYERFFIAQNGELHFRIEEPGTYRMSLTGFSGESVRIFDVTDLYGVKELIGFSDSGDSVVLHMSVEEPITFHAVAEKSWKSPHSLEKVTGEDLRDPSSGAEYLIIAYDDYLDAVGPLAQHRSAEYLVKTVCLSDVYNQFSWGLADPVAIRDFIAHAYHNWPDGERPLHVLLVGDATSDFRGRINAAFSNQLPTFYRIDPEGTRQRTYATDDYFTYVDPDTGAPDWAPEVAIGRLPAADRDEARVMVNKLVGYEANPQFGVWRNRLLLLADDELRGRYGADCAYSTFHTSDTEKIADLLPHSFEREKVYLMEYPMDSAFEKPKARDAYIRWIQEGILVSSYLGHGGGGNMADEHLLLMRHVTADLLRNDGRLHLFTAWSCSVGGFALLYHSSLAELLFKVEGGGSLGSFASTALSLGSASAALSRLFFGNLLPDDHLRVQIGLAAMAAKTVSGGSLFSVKANDEKYALLSDPALRLGVPELEVRFEGERSIKLRRGEEVALSGEVLETDGSLAASFSGEAFVTAHGMADTSGYHYVDSACALAPSHAESVHVPYALVGPTLYRGWVDVNQGRFRAPFFTALDASVGDLARISAYVFSPELGKDGSGGYDSVSVVEEPPGTSFADEEAPNVKIRVDGAVPRNGMRISHQSVFFISLEDESGINLQQNDRSATIHIEIDDRGPIDLTQLFEYERNSFQKGGLSFRFVDLPHLSIDDGNHTLAFRATDNLNNRAEIEYEVLLVPDDFSLRFRQEVLSYPNPFDPEREETRFVVDLTGAGTVTIQLFTHTGRLIRELEHCFPNGPALMPDCVWDGRDADGDLVGNGVYLVRATARSLDGSRSAESIGKSVVLRGAN